MIRRNRPFTRQLIGGVSRIKRDSYSNERSSWWDIRKQVFERDGGVCQSRSNGRVCGKPGKEVHHILPLSRGGTSTPANLLTFCTQCHEARHSHMRRK
jgi:5-methylcytosine-specific restriction protein A